MQSKVTYIFCEGVRETAYLPAEYLTLGGLF